MRVLVVGYYPDSALKANVMIFVIADDGVLHVLTDLAAVRRECESTDVEDGVYRFFDHDGRRLVPRFTEPVKRHRFLFGLLESVGGGQFELDADITNDRSEFDTLLAEVAALEPNPWFSTISEIARYVRDNE